MSPERVAGSFRDPSGFVFRRDGSLYRQVNRSFEPDFDAFNTSGLYADLSGRELLIPHRQASLELAVTDDAIAVLEPEVVPFISYPYEWCFGQLRDAALLTLAVQDRALEHGMVLRDASAYNIQFRGAKPVFIDTLSFGRYEEGRPWAAYRQFCEHFLAPLALMSRTDVRCAHMLRHHLDGVPLDLASRLLPRRTWLNGGLVIHLHMHARAQRRYAGDGGSEILSKRKLSRDALRRMVQHLAATVRSLEWKPAGTEWADYERNHNYNETAAASKSDLLREFLGGLDAKMIWDLGANTGMFSRVAAEFAPTVVALDIDPAAVELNYRRPRPDAGGTILPLLGDLTNPSPSQGWGHDERLSLAARGPADVALALALVHHLAISNNVPLERVAEYFASLCRYLIIEFVPKSDSKVEQLLRTREDIFPDYTADGFERAFSNRFRIQKRHAVAESERTLYLMRRHG